MAPRVVAWALVFLAAAAAAAAPEAVTIVDVRTVEAATLPAVPGAMHHLRLTAHTFRGTRWTSDEIVTAMTEAARLIAQCQVALAHAELRIVHVLSDSGEHSDEPGNLMRAETAPGNDTLTAAQCERLRSRGEANGLLRRSP